MGIEMGMGMRCDMSRGGYSYSYIGVWPKVCTTYMG